jgi:hypothetical protein
MPAIFGLGERLPLAKELAAMVAGDELKAAVLERRLVDADRDRDEVTGIALPAGLGILMRLEAVAARHLEVDLLLEQHGFLAEQLTGRSPQHLGKLREALMKERDVLDARNETRVGIEPARLVVHPVLP